MEGTTASNQIRNANPEGACATSPGCSLADMTAQSLNVPFYALTLELKQRAATVLETARAAGIRYMRDDSGKVYDLNAHKATELANTGQNTGSVFDYRIGFGQYGITVIDHANGVATLAAQGQAAKVHFIAEVYDGDTKIYTEARNSPRCPATAPAMPPTRRSCCRRFRPSTAGFRRTPRSAAKTGTWENGNVKGQNAHSWTVGYTAPNKSKGYNGLAVAVWVGNKGDELPIKTKSGEKMGGSNGGGEIFKAFIKKVTEGKSVGKFPEPKFLGDEDAGDGKSADPSSSQSQPGQGNPGPGNNNNRQQPRRPVTTTRPAPVPVGGGGNRGGRD